MPDQRAEEVDEAFQDADDHEAHKNPLPYLGGEGAFDDTAEAEADDGDGQSSHHRHPDGDTFDKRNLIHILNVFNRSLTYGCPRLGRVLQWIENQFDPQKLHV